MSVTISPTTSDDVSAFFPQASPWRIKAVTGRVDGEIKGIGGFAFLPNGIVEVFLEASEADCKRYPLTLHRTATRFLTQAKEQGVSSIMARTDKSREAAPRWLERLGFKRVGEFDGEVVYLWQK